MFTETMALIQDLALVPENKFSSRWHSNKYKLIELVIALIAVFKKIAAIVFIVIYNTISWSFF